MSVSDSLPLRRGEVVLGAAVRPLGSFPSGWRVDGANRDPGDDPKVLKRQAKEAERAHLDYLFFGDWFSNTPDLEYTDPYLLARIDPFSAVAFLASSTSRIGLIATVNTSYSDPFTTARTAASIDHLSGGRFGLNIVVGTEPHADANHTVSNQVGGRAAHRHAVAAEYLDVIRGIWDTWDDDAVVADAGSGTLVDWSRIDALDHEGESFRAAGPALSLRPVQGQIPIVHSDTSARALEFAARGAELHVVSPANLREGVAIARDLRAAAVAHGRAADSLAIVLPLLPVVGSTRADAWAIYDRLVELVPVADAAGAATSATAAGVPRDRTASAIRRLVGVPLLDRELDDPVSLADAERFNTAGVRLLEVVRRRSGRVPGTSRTPDYRHLLVAHLFPLPIVVGSAEDIADHIETWFRSGAADGFTVQSAYLHEQFEAFTRGVVPILVERGLFRAGYGTRTLRGHLGLDRPARVKPQQAEAAASASATEAATRTTPSRASAFDGVVGVF
ncbi:MAG: LLM class flavin-dependent oxidoreductase [Herbiconiux sp.]|uniref:NtaA/DmoA family FMN-dependent monooxygenase n=1 Tax=Herbiconiux sp. TaxID=1871186 RepID=UPI00120B4C3A|nr:NtaA/DmoA family FMN-dependent monooxygenase [Herbiconiux sp.]TAJ50190.1 MAG: LLM class flavin-dependent oxidoreductase [Herbiconiux sp.]